MPATESTRRTALWTGIAYLGIVASGLFAELFVRASLVVPGDAAATGSCIAASPGLFGAGVGADALMIALDVGVAFGLFRLLRGFDRRLALAATAFRLVQAAILAGNTFAVTRALGFAEAGQDGRALAAMELHALVYDVGLIAFGLACVTLGRLLRRAKAGPRLIALGLSATGVVYLVGSFAAVFAPSVSAALDPFYGIAIVVEPAVAIWLIVVGSRRATPPASALAHA
ncbi:MAG: DUF4386 domain-containing protein [Sandaracinaceae bacterium]|nr:DUF4386 domain-containing protein [Sandaracinaceae bacterium]